MIITAHGGALGTGRNSRKYFDTISAYKMEAIEVDIRKLGKTLYLSHTTMKFNMKKVIKLEYVFEYCKKHNLRVNCDLKKRGLLKHVVKLAKDMGVGHLIYITGSVSPREIKYLDAGEIYLNYLFFRFKYSLTVNNLPKIKEYIDSFKNERVAGININYKLPSVTDEMLRKAKEIGLKLSIFTVDSEEALKRFIDYAPANITTNIVDRALALRSEVNLAF